MLMFAVPELMFVAVIPVKPAPEPVNTPEIVFDALVAATTPENVLEPVKAFVPFKSGMLAESCASGMLPSDMFGFWPPDEDSGGLALTEVTPPPHA